MVHFVFEVFFTQWVPFKSYDYYKYIIKLLKLSIKRLRKYFVIISYIYIFKWGRRDWDIRAHLFFIFLNTLVNPICFEYCFVLYFSPGKGNGCYKAYTTGKRGERREINFVGSFRHKNDNLIWNFHDKG